MTYIHCLNNISKTGTDQLPASYELTDDIDAAAGILVRSAAMHDMEFSDKLLAIGRAGAGVNNIPLDRAAQEGIVVFNTPGANANAVKELVLCGMLLASRDVVGGIQWCKDNADDPDIAKSAEKAKKAFAGGEIAGKTLGVIGLGAIGAKVAQAAIALGMNAVGYDPFVSAEATAQIDGKLRYVADLADLYAASDFVSVHVPAMEDTKGMINADAFAQMTDGVVVLNFARDTLVNADDMAAALESGKVAAYVTDFATPAVMAMKGAIVIPHLGASTAEAEDNCAAMAARELADYIDQGIIVNSVNYPACAAEPIAAGAGRLCILHDAGQAVADAAISAATEAGAAVAGSQSAERGEAGYTLVDLAAPAADDVAAAVAAVAGVRRVRALG